MNKFVNQNKTCQSAIRIEDHFFKGSKELRSYYEDRFKTPLVADQGRFVWDYWLIENQYKLLRTPAESFFPGKYYEPFIKSLLNWGRNHLGCQMISHPWLSVYIDGCYQSLHSDVPHGPWSFVYSLTPWHNRTFKGGETVVAKPKLLNYFNHYTHSQSDERSSMFEEIEPKFNRLTVFDPRYPHGVNEVKGEDHLLKSRLVIHGWFTEPRPMIEGALHSKRAIPCMDKIAEYLINTIQDYYGLLTIRLKINSSGIITHTEILCGHLVNKDAQTIPYNELKKVISLAIKETGPFPKSSGFTFLTLPIEFRK